MSQCIGDNIIRFAMVTETPNSSAWTESRYSFAGKSIVVQPGLSWTLPLSKGYLKSLYFIHLSTISKMYACPLGPLWLHLYSYFKLESLKPRQKQGLTSSFKEEPWPFILFCLHPIGQTQSHGHTQLQGSHKEILYLSRWPYIWPIEHSHYLSKKGELTLRNQPISTLWST